MTRMHLVLLIAAVCASAVRAEVRLPAIFSDHMVLQRNMPVPVWGWAGPGEKVTVSFGSVSVQATAASDGRWTVKLPALGASAEPATLTVKAGETTVTIQDVVVGDVWLCSGQSNMAWQLSAAHNARDEIGKAFYPAIRLFTVPSGSPRMAAASL